MSPENKNKAAEQARAAHARDVLAESRALRKKMYTTTVSFSVKQDLAEALQEEADRQGIPRTELCREILEDYARKNFGMKKNVSWLKK